jgi:nucleoside-diphosphate-sugar epimerase
VESPPSTTAVRGDLGDPGSLTQAVEGVDAIVHLAALFRTPDEDAIWRPTSTGHEIWLPPPKPMRPKRASSWPAQATSTTRTRRAPGRESDACAPTAAYPASKLAAEDHLRSSNLTWSILRLPFVYGDGDGHLAMMPELAPRSGCTRRTPTPWRTTATS